MKTTIYELLVMINEGKAPKTIKSEGHYYYYNELEKDYYEGMAYDYEYLLANISVKGLDNEIEIIEYGVKEENKIPEKLSTWFSLEKDCENDNIQYANNNFETIYKKINEICDYLKSKEK